MRICLRNTPITMSKNSSRSHRMRRRLSEYKMRIFKMEQVLFQNCESSCELYAKENYICYSKECFRMHNDIKELFWKVNDLEHELNKYDTEETEQEI